MQSSWESYSAGLSLISLTCFLLQHGSKKILFGEDNWLEYPPLNGQYPNLLKIARSKPPLSHPFCPSFSFLLELLFLLQLLYYRNEKLTLLISFLFNVAYPNKKRKKKQIIKNLVYSTCSYHIPPRFKGLVLNSFFQLFLNLRTFFPANLTWKFKIPPKGPLHGLHCML